jgi:hypothetical protein
MESHCTWTVICPQRVRGLMIALLRQTVLATRTHFGSHKKTAIDQAY